MSFPVIISASVSGTCSDDTFVMNTNTCYGDILNDTLSGTEHGLFHCRCFLKYRVNPFRVGIYRFIITQEVRGITAVLCRDDTCVILWPLGHVHLGTELTTTLL